MLIWREGWRSSRCLQCQKEAGWAPELGDRGPAASQAALWGSQKLRLSGEEQSNQALAVTTITTSFISIIQGKREKAKSLLGILNFVSLKYPKMSSIQHFIYTVSIKNLLSSINGSLFFFFFNRSLWSSGDKHEQIWGLFFQPRTVSSTVLAQGRSMSLGTVENDTSDKTCCGSLLTVANTMFQ